CARRFLGRGARTADENALAARRLAGPGRRKRAADRRDRNRRQRAAAAPPLAYEAFVERLGALDERDAEDVGACADRYSKGDLLGPARSPRARCPDDRYGGAHTVDRELDLVRLAHGAGGLDLDRVLGVEREVARHRETAARAEREPVDALVLRQLLGEPM